MTAVISAECRGCGACLLTCPVHAVRPADPLRSAGPGGHSAPWGHPRPRWPQNPLLVLPNLCNDCGECVEICPADAIEVVS